MRLTKDIRNQILDAVLAHRFTDEETSLEESFRAFADDYYRALFSPEEWELINNCPREWFYVSTDICARYQGRSQFLKMSSEERVPQSLKREDMLDTQARRYAKLLERRTKYQKLRCEVSQHAAGVLNSVTTVKRLLEVWPEVKKFIPTEFSKPDVTTALAIPMKQLNEKLRLP